MANFVPKKSKNTVKILPSNALPVKDLNTGKVSMFHMTPAIKKLISDQENG